jgi:hypothetical protein
MPVTNIIRPDGSIVRRQWDRGTRPSLDWLRRAVAGPDQHEGWIELLLDDERERVTAWGNEEGRLLKLPANVLAMKTIGWRPPPEGWDAYDGHMGNQPMMQVFTSREERDAAMAEQWSPVVGPVVLCVDFEQPNDEGDYPETSCNPDSLGIEFAAPQEQNQNIEPG